MLMTQRGALSRDSQRPRRAPARGMKKEKPAEICGPVQLGEETKDECQRHLLGVYRGRNNIKDPKYRRPLYLCFKAYGYKAFSRLLFGESWPPNPLFRVERANVSAFNPLLFRNPSVNLTQFPTSQSARKQDIQN